MPVTAAVTRLLVTVRPAPTRGRGCGSCLGAGHAVQPVAADAEEIAQLRGTLEEQQNEIQRLKQEALERYQDLDKRLSGGAAGAAVNQNSSAAGAINATVRTDPTSAGSSQQ